MCSLLIYDVNFVLLTSPHHAIASTSKLAWGGFWQYLKLMNAQNLCGRVGVLSADKHLQQVTEGSLFLWKILETTKEALSRVWARQMQLILMCLTQILFRVASILLPTEHAKYYYSYEQTTSYSSVQQGANQNLASCFIPEFGVYKCYRVIRLRQDVEPAATIVKGSQKSEHRRSEQKGQADWAQTMIYPQSMFPYAERMPLPEIQIQKQWTVPIWIQNISQKKKGKKKIFKTAAHQRGRICPR